MSKKARKDLEAFYLQTLAQSVAEREEDISDYACNVFADKIAEIDIVLMGLDENEDKELIEELNALREAYKRIGTALWFMEAGELSNLGARLGSSIQHHKVREQE